MRTHPATAFRLPFRKPLSVKIAAFLAVFMVFNSAVSVPLPAMQIHAEEFSGIIAAQSAITSFFYHSTLPLMIVNKYLSALSSGNSAAPRPEKQKEKKHHPPDRVSMTASSSFFESKDNRNEGMPGGRELPRTAARMFSFVLSMIVYRMPLPSHSSFQTVINTALFSLARSDIEASSPRTFLNDMQHPV